MSEIGIKAGAPAAAVATSGRSDLSEWRRGLPVVITSFFGIGIGVLASWSIGLFMEPIETETGWGRGQISAGIVMLSVVGFLAAPIVGRMIDVLGVRKIGLTGMVLYCLGLGLLSAAGDAIWQWWGLWLFLALGYVLVKPTLWAVAVSQRFDRQRGLALAVTMCGSGVLLIVMPGVVESLIADYGWRMSYIILGAGSALLTLPLMILFLREQPRAHQVKSSELTEEGRAEAAVAKAELRTALFSSRFLRLLVAGVLLTLAIIGIQVHFIPLLEDDGVDRPTAALIASMIGVGAIIGRLTCGFLVDRFRGQIVGAIFFLLPVFSTILLLNYNGTVLLGCVIAFVQGLALGAEMDVIAFLVSRYFGLRNYGTLLGTVVGFLMVGNGTGPTLAGWVYDMTGSYEMFLIAAIPAFLICALLVGTLGDYPRHDDEKH